MADWNSELYLKFKAERTQPAHDLAARIPLRDARSILDIGCGPGNSTAAVAARYPGACTGRGQLRKHGGCGLCRTSGI